jgi:PKD repeat protein
VQFTSTDPSVTSWLWNFGSGNTSTDANPIFNFPFDNIWPVSLIVSNECGTDTLNELVNVIKNGFDEMGNFSFYLLYQNDKLILTGNSIIPQNYNIELLSSSGQFVEKRSVQLSKDWQFEIAVQHYTPGLYFLNIANETGRKTKRLMID